MDYQEFCINKFIQEGIPGMVEDLKAKNLTADEAGIKQWISDKHYTNSLIFVELKILEDPYYRKRACMILFTFKYYRDEVPIGFPKYAIITVLDHKSKSDAGYYILERQSNDSWQILICDDMVDSDYSPIADYKTIEEFANAVKELIYKRNRTLRVNMDESNKMFLEYRDSPESEMWLPFKEDNGETHKYKFALLVPSSFLLPYDPYDYLLYARDEDGIDKTIWIKGEKWETKIDL